MTLTLAFAAHSAGSSRQRARCTQTGRFVSWSAAALLRSAKHGEVIHVSLAPSSKAVPAPVAVAASVEGVEVVAPLAGAKKGIVEAAASIVAAAASKVSGLLGRLTRGARRVAGGLTRIVRAVGIVALAVTLAGDADRTSGSAQVAGPGPAQPGEVTMDG